VCTVQSSMLHGSETWPIKNENEVALQQAEMRMVRCLMCEVLQQKVCDGMGIYCKMKTVIV